MISHWTEQVGWLVCDLFCTELRLCDEWSAVGTIDARILLFVVGTFKVNTKLGDDD